MLGREGGVNVGESTAKERPSLGESVSVRGERGWCVSAISAQSFVVHRVGSSPIRADDTLFFDVSTYGTGDKHMVRPDWSCGHVSHSLPCILPTNHLPPHVYRPRPLR